jgi:hypothetical protein
MTADASSIADATWRGARKRHAIGTRTVADGTREAVAGATDGTREVVAPGNYMSMPARARAIERKSANA